MTGDGKVDSGTGWVRRTEDGVVMIAALERWYYVHGPGQANEEVEYRVNGEVVKP